MGSFSIWHWLVVLLIVVLIFGTKKLKNIGTDLGGAVKGFKDGVRDGGTGNAAAPDIPPSPQQVAAGQRDAAERTIDVDARPAGSSGSGAGNNKSSS